MMDGRSTRASNARWASVPAPRECAAPRHAAAEFRAARPARTRVPLLVRGRARHHRARARRAWRVRGEGVVRARTDHGDDWSCRWAVCAVLTPCAVCRSVTRSAQATPANIRAKGGVAIAQGGHAPGAGHPVGGDAGMVARREVQWWARESTGDTAAGTQELTLPISSAAGRLQAAVQLSCTLQCSRTPGRRQLLAALQHRELSGDPRHNHAERWARNTAGSELALLLRTLDSIAVWGVYS